MSLVKDAGQPNLQAYTSERVRELRRKLLHLQIVQAALTMGAMALFVGALFLSFSDRATLFGFSVMTWWIAWVPTFIMLVIFSLTKCRCPGCGRLLGGLNRTDQYCQCGLPLRWWLKS